MTAFSLSALLETAMRLLGELVHAWTEFLSGIRRAHAMALRYQTLSGLSDRELAARGLTRQDIPGAVLAAFHRR
jgi:hypothetical protein